LKEEGLNFNLKLISKQNSKNSIFGEFSKVGENTWAVSDNFYPTFDKKSKTVSNTKNGPYRSATLLWSPNDVGDTKQSFGSVISFLKKTLRYVVLA